MNHELKLMPLPGADVPKILPVQPERARAIGAAAWKVLSSPWVRKPAYFVASVAAVTVGFGIAIAQAFITGDGEDDDIDFAAGIEAEKEAALPPSPFAVGARLDANKAYPGLYAMYLSEQDRQYRERQIQSSPFSS